MKVLRAQGCFLALAAALSATGLSGYFAFADEQNDSCQPVVTVFSLVHRETLFRIPASQFSLSWKHSVTLSTVVARYKVDRDGRIHQLDERFTDHGPGLSHTSDGWRVQDDSFVVPINRPIGSFVLRTSPEHENRLSIVGQTVDLTKWPARPLEIRATGCSSTDAGR